MTETIDTSCTERQQTRTITSLHNLKSTPNYTRRQTMIPPIQQIIIIRRQQKQYQGLTRQHNFLLRTMLLYLMLFILQPRATIAQQQQQQQQFIQNRQRKLQNDDDLGDLATFNLEPFTPNISYRQNVCHRYDAFRNGTIELRNALQGLNIHPIIKLNQYFNYDIETGIDPDDPGLVGTLLDELADRAGFTWRDSFAIFDAPTSETVNNVTWTFTDLLVWNIETYDVAINYWDQSVERMELGVAYIEPWFDGSVILIDQANPTKEATINLFNWLLPFHAGVWLLTILTVMVSGCVHQLIEYFNEERNERSFWQWFWDNSYLSWLNVTQNYEYAPNSLSGRIFGISMGIWALVMTATYTANLASLLVEHKIAPTVVDSIDKAIVLGIPICTYANTNADIIIKRRYRDAIRVPKPSELEAYEALRRGECGLVAGYKDNWLGNQKDRRYNPECDLEWVGQTIEVIKSGFATNADSGHLCSSLIRDVFNLHLTELIRDGVLEEAWETHRATAAGVNTIDCLAGDSATNDDHDSSARFLRDNREQYSSTLSSRHEIDDPTSVAFGHRKLKGGGGGNSAAASGGGDGVEGERLTIQQMAGIFVLHFVMMVIAVVVSAIDRYLRTRDEHKAAAAAAVKRCEEDTPAANVSIRPTERFPTLNRQVSYRAHGPIIGSAPPINTYMKTGTSRPPGAFWHHQELYGNVHIDRHHASAPQEGCPDDPERYNFGAPPTGRLNFVDLNDKSIIVFESRICNLEKSVLTTQQELKNSHDKMQSQMDMLLSLMQDMHKNKVGSVGDSSTGG